jgi:hypothetical protein
MVERTCRAVVDAPARVSATSRGHPVRRQGVAARFVKPMYPPTVPAATPELTNLIFNSEVAQVRTRAPQAGPLAPAQPAIATANKVAPTRVPFGLRLICPRPYGLEVGRRALAELSAGSLTAVSEVG